MTSAGIRLAPVAGKARIEVLDILRGIAILGIFYMNLPFMAASVWAGGHDIRSIGWSSADATTYAVIGIFWEGTQRGLLEFLFGAGMMVLTAKAMEPDGPVAVADLYYRRNLWLLLFGLADVFLLLWPGDILHIYALAALFLFPFRKLGARTLLALGLSWAIVTAGLGGMQYAERASMVAKVEAVQAKQAAHQPIGKEDQKTLQDWQKKLDRFNPAKTDEETRKNIAEEQKARSGGDGAFGYISWVWQAWITFVGKGSIWFSVPEAFCAMLIGIALWKWRIIQGGRSTGFYLVMTLAAYGIGCTMRAIGIGEIYTFSPIPKTIWITQEFGRLFVSLGHVGLVNFAVKSAVGARIFAPFKAAGRTAFSLYFLQQSISMWLIFSPFGLGLWGKMGWAEMAGFATVYVAVQLVMANIWTRYFISGPFEWLWRSLAYVKWQPFRLSPRGAAMPDEPLPGPNALPA